MKYSVKYGVMEYFLPFLLAVLTLMGGQAGAYAAEMTWRVSKASGDVWVSASGVQKASLGDQSDLNPGDLIRTGGNGRVLLVRGEETILIAPNSVVGLPTEKKEGLQTTIIQQTGSILLAVEKRNVKHFEVETPYLAAVVKGTRFRVSVNKFGTNVDVLQGKVEVADFKSGQFALVLPGQTARVAVAGKAGLALSGSGTLSPIRQGKPRATAVERVRVPKGGLSAPKKSNNAQQVRAIGKPGKVQAALGNGTNKVKARGIGNARGMRIKAAVGEVNVNFNKVTKGLARGVTAPGRARGAGNRSAPGAKKTVWNSGGLTAGNGASKAHGLGNGNGKAGATSKATGNASAAAKGNNGVANGHAGGVANGLGNGNGNGKGKGKKS